MTNYYHNKPIVIELLLQNLANVIEIDEGRDIAKKCELKNKLNDQLILSLIKKGANCTISSKYQTTLQCAVEYNNVDIIRLIVSRMNRNHLSAVNFIGESALHTAICMKNKTVINMLLQHGIDVNLIERLKRRTALHLALESNVSKQIIRSLLRYGADCNLSSNYQTTLQYAIAYDNYEITKLITARIHPDYINNVNFVGESALHNAMRMSNLFVIKLLMNHNINFNILDNNRKTPMDIVLIINSNNQINYNNIQIIEMMLTHDNMKESRRYKFCFHNYFFKIMNNFTRSTKEKHNVYKTDSPFGNYNTSHFFTIFELLLSEGPSPTFIWNWTMLELIQTWNIDDGALALMLLTLVKRKQLTYDSIHKGFSFYDFNQKLECMFAYDKWISHLIEIEKLYTIEISPTHEITYFQLLCMNKYKVASLLARSGEIEKILINFDNIKKIFPIYGWMIKRKYVIGNNLYLRIEECMISVSKMLGNPRLAAELELPFNHIILKYLTEFDISNVIAASRKL